MEQNFQTSFIPKKPMVEERAVAPRPIGLLTIFAIFILLFVIILSGGLFIYKGILNSSIAQMTNDLNLAKNRFEPSKITQLQTLDKRLNAATTILAQHITVTPIFVALEDVTMKTVRYTNFTYTMDDAPNAPVKVHLEGEAVGYRSIALQADLLAKNEHLIQPVFSNLVLNDKGNVLFNLDFSVDRSFVDYKQNLETGNGGATTPTN